MAQFTSRKAENVSKATVHKGLLNIPRMMPDSTMQIVIGRVQKGIHSLVSFHRQHTPGKWDCPTSRAITIANSQAQEESLLELEGESSKVLLWPVTTFYHLWQVSELTSLLVKREVMQFTSWVSLNQMTYTYVYNLYYVYLRKWACTEKKVVSRRPATVNIQIMFRDKVGEEVPELYCRG